MIPPVDPDSESDYRRLTRASDLLVRHLELATAPTVTPIPGAFGPVGLSPSMFAYGMARAMAVLGEPRGKRFLDVGAGIGTKLLLASWLYPGLIVEGIEHCESCAKTAWSLGADGVMLADAFEFDRYSEYDIVFAWRPCSDWELEETLEKRLYKLMAPGAVLFFVAAITEPNGWETISGSVWRKPRVSVKVQVSSCLSGPMPVPQVQGLVDGSLHG